MAKSVSFWPWVATWLNEIISRDEESLATRLVLDYSTKEDPALLSSGAVADLIEDLLDLMWPSHEYKFPLTPIYYTQEKL